MTVINNIKNWVSRRFEIVKFKTGLNLFLCAVLAGLNLAQPGALANENTPLAHVASPDVYRILA